MNQTKMFFCGDIGGTYSRLTLYMNTNNELKNYEALYSFFSISELLNLFMNVERLKLFK